MNKSEKIIKKIEEVETKSIPVHNHKEKDVDHYLSSNKIKHTKKRKHTTVNGYPYLLYGGFRPEIFGGFSTFCHQSGAVCNPTNMDATGGADVGSAAGGGETGGAGVSGT